MITLKLKLKDQEIELTLHDAKILYDELHVLFDKKDNGSVWPPSPYIPAPIFGTPKIT